MSNIKLKQENSTVIKKHGEILVIIEEIKQFEQRFPEFEIEESEVKEELIEIEQKPKEFEFPIEQKEPTSPTVFRLRFTEDGKLENIDLKKPKPRIEKHSRLKTQKTKNKGKKEKLQTTKKESNNSKLKGIISKIGKLKRVIPSRGKNEEELKESEE